LRNKKFKKPSAKQSENPFKEEFSSLKLNKENLINMFKNASVKANSKSRLLEQSVL